MPAHGSHVMTDRTRRRTVLRSIGVATTAGLLAGCSTDTGDGDGSGDGGPSAVDPPSAVDDYLSGDPEANNYDGDMMDYTDAGAPTVEVGAGEGLAFGPAAVKVSTGTTVTWEWTGQGGDHNVVHQDEAFNSGSAVDEEGHTFEHTFDEAGTFLYYCGPHQTVGMKGAVVVE